MTVKPSHHIVTDGFSRREKGRFCIDLEGVAQTICNANGVLPLRGSKRQLAAFRRLKPSVTIYYCLSEAKLQNFATKTNNHRTNNPQT